MNNQTIHLESIYDTSIQKQQQSIGFEVYLPMIGMFGFYTLIYIIRYIHWRMKQRRRKIRLLEYEKLRWLWHQHHQKQLNHINIPPVQQKKTDDDDGCLYFDHSSSSSSSLSVTTINENEKELDHHRDINCDDRGHSRTSSLVLTIPAPTYHPHDPSPNHEKAHKQQNHHHYQHHHQCSMISNTHTSANVESYYSSSSSTTTLACSCRNNRSFNKEEKKSCTSFISSPTTTPSSFDPTPTFYYRQYSDLTNQVNNSKIRRNREGGGDDSHHGFIVPTYKKDTSSSFPSSCWSFYDTKAKRRNMVWKWSVAMGHCHYDHAKTITSIIDQLDKPPSR